MGPSSPAKHARRFSLLDGVTDANVDLVWDPLTPDRMVKRAKKLGMV
jgi:metal-sulfur cluster biosynthetic enzyme